MESCNRKITPVFYNKFGSPKGMSKRHNKEAPQLRVWAWHKVKVWCSEVVGTLVKTRICSIHFFFHPKFYSVLVDVKM